MGRSDHAGADPGGGGGGKGATGDHALVVAPGEAPILYIASPSVRNLRSTYAANGPVRLKTDDCQ